MKITAIVLGSYGDVTPFIVLGKELSKRGHIFSIATFAEYEKVIWNSGLQFNNISGNSDEIVSVLLGNSQNTRNDGVNGIKFLLLKYPQLYDEFYGACKNSDLIIYMQFGALAYHFADKFGIPVIRTFVFPFEPTKQYAPLMPHAKRNSIFSYIADCLCSIFMSWASLEEANIWRKKLGLKKWHIYNSYKKINGKKIVTLYQYNEILAKPDPKWGKHIFITGNWVESTNTAPQQIEKGLEDFLDKSNDAIYVGFGSMKYKEMDKLYSKIISILVKKNIKAILPVQCKSLVEKMIYKNKDNFYFIGFVPFEKIFPKMKAVVHHGGAGTVHSCLAYGIPQLIFAFGADQFFWGQQCHELGIGPEPIDIKRKIDFHEMEEKILSVVNEDSYRQKAQQLSVYITKDGAKKAADIIKRIL